MPTVAPAPPRALERPVWWPLALDPFLCGVALISAAVLGFLLAQLNAWPPHEDETLAFFVGRQPIGDLFGTVLGERGGAPLHFLLTHLVATVSPGLTGLRLISVFFAVASVPVIACLVARLTDRATALLATLLVGTSWTLLMHGIYGRMYSLFLFTSTLSFLALLRALSEGGWKRWLLWIVVMLATLASMPYGAMVLGVQAAYVIGRRLRRPFLLRPALLSFAAVTLVDEVEHGRGREADDGRAVPALASVDCGVRAAGDGAENRGGAHWSSKGGNSGVRAVVSGCGIR